MDYRSIIESKYNRQSWIELLYDIFKSKAVFKTSPVEVNSSSALVNKSYLLGSITLSDGKKIAVYEIQLSNIVDIKANRVGIRNLLVADWKSRGCAGAFMFCFKDDESILRFSYVSEVQKIINGRLNNISTDTKRFTYLLGAGIRCRTATKQFEDLRDSKLGLEDITKAFSLQALNDRFFDEYRALYETIICYVTGKKVVKDGKEWKEITVGEPDKAIISSFSIFEDPEKAIRDYVKKILGRIVFLQFIQKKGWLGVPVGNDWGSGDKEFLQHIFDVCVNKSSFVDSVLEPLFNDINTKRDGDVASKVLGEDIRIPFLNGGLFELDEADGCTFNLPESLVQEIITFFNSYNFTIDENSPDDEEFGIDPEMLGRIFESLLEDNKLKGTFYTRKEIVEQLCKDALINYLQSGFKNEESKALAKTFVDEKDASILGIKEREVISQLLRDVKVCDPAVGSGAFPMGMLREITACRMQLENLSQISPSDIKKHIIERNLYGVDIEKGAVDIARLRLWLTLIIDDNQPHILPNLDFKIIQGNSLMDISGDTSDDADTLEELCDSVHEVYHTENHSQKRELISKIDHTIREHLEKTSSGIEGAVESFSTIPIPNQFFTLWHLYFKDVFDNGGFDIVIGNPPYVESKNYIEDSPLLARFIKQTYECAQSGKVDLCIPFIELGINLLNQKGTLNYLVQRRFFMSDYGELLRSKIYEKNLLKKIYEYLNTDMFRGKTTYVSELLLQNSNKSDTFCYGNTESDLPKELPMSVANGLWNFKEVDESASIISRLKNTFGVIGDHIKIKVGLQVLWKDAYHIFVDRIENGLIHGHSKIDPNVVVEVGACRALVQNESFISLAQYTPSLYTLFPYDISDTLSIYRIPFEEFSDRYPKAGSYLSKYKNLICEKVQTLPELKPVDREQFWHLFTREQNLTTVEPKVVIPMTSVYPKATVITDLGVYCDNSNVNFASFADNSLVLLYAFAAIVSTKLFGVMAKKEAIELRGGYSKYNKQYISLVAFPYDSFDEDNSIIIELSNIAQEIKLLYNVENDNRDMAKIQRLTDQIESLTCDLYGIRSEDYQILIERYNG